MKKSELNKIAKNKKVTHCYIKKGSYYRPNSCGYTDFQSLAGVFTKEEAISEANHCNDVWIIPINNESHNKMIVQAIKELSTRLI